MRKRSPFSGVWGGRRSQEGGGAREGRGRSLARCPRPLPCSRPEAGRLAGRGGCGDPVGTIDAMAWVGLVKKSQTAPKGGRGGRGLATS